MDVVDILKALSDETRIRILNLLRKGSLCVCEIEVVLQISQSNASRHLNRLRNVNLIVSEKQAQWVYFHINDGLITQHPFVGVLLEQGLDGITKCQYDFERLKRYKEQGGGCENMIALED